MSNINMIQNRLKELSGGEFQKIMDTYFYKNIDGIIYPEGSALGSNNTKTGTPDTYIITPEGEYIFIEYTVQKSGVYDKFMEDIEKCLDESKTKIPLKSVKKIICACTVNLKEEEIYKLTKKIKDNNIEGEILTISSISFKLREEANILKEFLGISIDTEQIFDIDDFINVYDGATLSTPLDISIYGRNREIQQVIESIANNKITIISGKTGVGKTRLAIECIRIFKQSNSNYTIKCLRNNGQNIFEDLKIYFSKEGNYLLFIDDVNQTTYLNVILDYLSKDKEGINFKIILTVRDYATKQIEEEILNHKSDIINLNNLDKVYIESLCKDFFKEYRSEYIDRIYSISKGNPRLAVMSCVTLKEENSLDSISNSIGLLQRYYSSIKRDLDNKLNNIKLLKLISIISFLDYIDLNNDYEVDTILKDLNLSKDILEQYIHELHEMEILDIYKDRIVKISDQILGTYIFYHTVCNNRFIKYNKLIKLFFKEKSHIFINQIQGILEYFNTDDMREYFRNEVIEAYDEFKATEYEEEYLYKFKYFLTDEFLLYIKEKIQNISVNDKYYQINAYDMLLQLIAFKYTNYCLDAVDLILEYIDKVPEDYSTVLSLLKDMFNFNELSYEDEFISYIILLRKLNTKYKEKKTDINKNLLLDIIEYFMKFGQRTASLDTKSLEIVNHNKFELYITKELLYFRGEIWSVLISLYIEDINKTNIEKLLSKYSYYNDYRCCNKDLFKFDYKYMIKVVESIKSMSTVQYIIFNKISKMYSNYGIHVEEEFLKLIKFDEYELINILMNKDLYDYIDEKKHQILGVQEYKYIFRICNDIHKCNSIYIHGTMLQDNIGKLIKFVKKEYIKEVVDNLILYEYSIDINPLVIIKAMINSIGVKETDKFINSIRVSNRELWEYYFLSEVCKVDDKHKYIQRIYSFFDKIDSLGDFYLDLSLMKSYIEVDKKLFIEITKIVLKKDNDVINKALSVLFDTEKNSYKDLFIYYDNDLDLFIDAYIKIVFMNNETFADLNLIRAFIVQYNSSIINNVIDTWIRNYYELDVISNCNLSFLWLENNWIEFIQIVLDKIENYNLNKYDRLRLFAIEFYSIKDLDEFDLEENIEIKRRKIEFIRRKIIEYRGKPDKINLLFEFISNTDNDIKANLIVETLNASDLVKIEKIITFDKEDRPFIDTINYFNEQLGFYNNIYSRLYGLNQVENRKYLKNIIGELKKIINNEEINEFMIN